MILLEMTNIITEGICVLTYMNEVADSKPGVDDGADACDWSIWKIRLSDQAFECRLTQIKGRDEYCGY